MANAMVRLQNLLTSGLPKRNNLRNFNRNRIESVVGFINPCSRSLTQWVTAHTRPEMCFIRRSEESMYCFFSQWYFSVYLISVFLMEVFRKTSQSHFWDKAVSGSIMILWRMVWDFPLNLNSEFRLIKETLDERGKGTFPFNSCFKSFVNKALYSDRSKYFITAEYGVKGGRCSFCPFLRFFIRRREFFFQWYTRYKP